MNDKLVNQEYELKKWQSQSTRELNEKLTADYEWKLEQQKTHYQQVLIDQKNYYENNFLLVKMSRKLKKKKAQIKNKIKKIFKKN